MFRQQLANRLHSFRTTAAWLVVGTSVLVLWVAAANASSATLQTEPTDDVSTITQTATPTPSPTIGWSAPVNISNSGAATNLQSVAIFTDTMHVLWQETGINSFFYVLGDERGWTQPKEIELPFGTAAYYPDLTENESFPLFSPELVADSSGRIHAFWIDETASLQYSRLEEEPFDSFDAWSSRELLAEGVLAAKAVTDTAGGVHLSYIRSQHTEASPAGVYYRQHGDDSDWSEPVLIHQSLYFHAIDTEQANLQITTAGENGSVYVVWDNPLLEQVFLARSADQGLSWQPALLIDSREPDDDLTASGPSKIMVGVSENNILLLWQAGHNGNLCAQYFVWSRDGGETWQPRRQLEALKGCGDTNQLLTTDGQPLFLLTTVADETYLLAWDGEQWSAPRPQDPLAQFVNPDTNQVVELGCHQGHLGDSRIQQLALPDESLSPQLVVVGCGEGNAKDIWFISRHIGTTQDWFPPPAAWNRPDTAVRSNEEFHDLQLITDEEGRLHLTWTQEDNLAIYYALQNGNWSQPLARLTSPDGQTSQPRVTLGPSEHLLIVWSDPQSGRIYFSTAEASEAVKANSWSSPVTLVSATSVATSPDVAVGEDGIIYVTYVIPLNEGRGIYLTRSHDNGNTWSSPSLIYDASTATRAKVDELDLTIDGHGQLHLLWQQHRLPQELDPYALYYTHSFDGGESWSSAELVLEGPIRWSALISGKDNWLYRAWQVSRGEAGTSLQFQSSQDFGRSWSNIGVLTTIDGLGFPAAVTVDKNNEVHLFQPNRQTIQHWIAEDGSWSVAERLELPDEPTMLAAAAGPSNTLFVAYTAAESAGEANNQQYLVQVVSRKLDEAAGLTPGSVATLTPAPPTSTPASVTPTPLPTPLPTPTQTFPREFDEDSGFFSFMDSDSPVSQLLAGLIPTTLIVIVVVASVLGVKRLRMYAHRHGKE